MIERKHDGLSPSSLSEFASCNKKFFFRKIAKVEKDKDVDDDVESLNVGKAFHKCLEDTRHVLDGYSLQQCTQVVLDHGLNTHFHAPLIFSMLRAYKSSHEKSKLKAVAFEVAIDTPEFYGIVDVVLEDEKGWWIGDTKTAGSYNPAVLPTFPRHPQLNLYAYHKDQLAETVGLSPEKFLGCRYRMITKSKMQRKENEETAAFIGRLSKTVKSYDFILPVSMLSPEEIYKVHASAREFIEKNKGDERRFTKNYGSCFLFYRPCQFYSQCHGNTYTKMPDLECIASD